MILCPKYLAYSIEVLLDINQEYAQQIQGYQWWIYRQDILRHKDSQHIFTKHIALYSKLFINFSGSMIYEDVRHKLLKIGDNFTFPVSVSAKWAKMKKVKTW